MARDHDPIEVLVLSDTHVRGGTLERLPAEVWALADAADLILHAGDLTDAALLDELGRRAETIAVLGNNDVGLDERLPESVELAVGGHRVAMIHDSGARSGRAERLRRRFPAAELVVFGHSHEPVDEEGRDGQRLFNPGSPTQRRRQPVHTVGRLRISAGALETDHIEVGPYA